MTRNVKRGKEKGENLTFFHYKKTSIVYIVWTTPPGIWKWKCYNETNLLSASYCFHSSKHVIITPWDLIKDSGFKHTGVQVKSPAGPLPASLTCGFQQLLGWVGHCVPKYIYIYIYKIVVITLNSMKTLLLTPIIPIPKGRWIYKSYNLYRLFTFHQFFNSYQAKISSIILFHLFQFQSLFTHQNKQAEQNWFQINQHQI